VLRNHALAITLRNMFDRNRWFSIALLAGFFLRLLAMIGYPGALWFSGDSYVYLGAALRPIPDASKPTGYSLFLRLLLPFHSFTLVTFIQHMAGLGVAVMIYALLRRYGVSKKWATIATLPQLLDGFVVEDEHMIMAEAIAMFCLMLATLLLLWTTQARWWVALIAGLLVGYTAIAYPTDIVVIDYDFHLHYVTSTYSMLPPKNQAWIPPLTTAHSAYNDWLNYGHQDPGAVVKPVAVVILGYERFINTLGPLLAIILAVGLGGVLTITRRPWRLRLRRRQGSMFPWITAVVLLIFPIASADFDYRYLLTSIAFACLAAGLGFAPVQAKPEPTAPGAGAAEEHRQLTIKTSSSERVRGSVPPAR
jgi:hypothetical protein